MNCFFGFGFAPVLGFAAVMGVDAVVVQVFLTES